MLAGSKNKFASPTETEKCPHLASNAFSAHENLVLNYTHTFLFHSRRASHGLCVLYKITSSKAHHSTSSSFSRRTAAAASVGPTHSLTESSQPARGKMPRQKMQAARGENKIADTHKYTHGSLSLSFCCEQRTKVLARCQPCRFSTASGDFNGRIWGFKLLRFPHFSFSSFSNFALSTHLKLKKADVNNEMT
jgi:hypothetical protein